MEQAPDRPRQTKTPTEAEACVSLSPIRKLHFSDELTVVRILVIEVLTPFMLARIASAMPAMTSPYSMAVAADRSTKKPESKGFKTMSFWQRQDGFSSLRQGNPEPRT